MKATPKRLLLLFLFVLGFAGFVAGIASFLLQSAEHPSADLEAGDILVFQPGAVQAGQAAAPMARTEDEGLVRTTLQAGMAAAMAEDLEESVRFISPNYRDALGFNFNVMRRFLKRAYEQFDEPLIQLPEPPEIAVKGAEALVRVKARVSAIYRGRRNYLLGDEEVPNTIFVRFEKVEERWKVVEIKGLMPLGFDEKFLRFLGDSLGLPLTHAEKQERKRFCMPCRKKMGDRFGPLR